MISFAEVVKKVAESYEKVRLDSSKLLDKIENTQGSGRLGTATAIRVKARLDCVDYILDYLNKPETLNSILLKTTILKVNETDVFLMVQDESGKSRDVFTEINSEDGEITEERVSSTVDFLATTVLVGHCEAIMSTVAGDFIIRRTLNEEPKERSVVPVVDFHPLTYSLDMKREAIRRTVSILERETSRRGAAKGALVKTIEYLKELAKDDSRYVEIGVKNHYTQMRVEMKVKINHHLLTTEYVSHLLMSEFDDALILNISDGYLTLARSLINDYHRYAISTKADGTLDEDMGLGPKVGGSGTGVHDKAGSESARDRIVELERDFLDERYILDKTGTQRYRDYLEYIYLQYKVRFLDQHILPTDRSPFADLCNITTVGLNEAYSELVILSRLFKDVVVRKEFMTLDYDGMNKVWIESELEFALKHNARIIDGIVARTFKSE